MKNSFELLLIALLLIFSKCDYDEDDYSSYEDEENYSINYKNVLTFTDNNFTEISSYEKLLLIAYTPNCIRCQELMPAFVDTANYLIDEKKSDIKFAKIDLIYNQNFSQEYGIENVPMVLFIQKNKKILYNGYRTKENLLKFINKIFNGSITEIDNLNILNEYISKNKFVLLSTLKNKNSSIYNSFKNVSDSLDKLDSISCISKECIEKYGENEIILFKKFEEKINYYSKDFGEISKITNESLFDFVGSFSFENGLLLKEESLQMLFIFHKNIIFYLRNSTNETQTKYDKIFKEIGNKLRKKNIYTVVSDTEGNDLFEQTKEFFVVPNSHLPTLLFYDNNISNINLVTYRISNIKENQLNEEYILNYVKNILDGKIKRDLKSSFPMNQLSLDFIGARMVVGSTYDELVTNEKNNLILLLANRAYFCELCNLYLDEFKTLGHKHKNDKNPKVIYAVMDGVENEARDLSWEYDDLPLVFLFTNAMKDKKVIKFVPKNHTEISEREIVEFVGKNLGWDKDYIEKHLAQPDPRIKEEKEKKEKEKKEKEEKEKKEDKDDKKDKEDKKGKETSNTDL